MLISTVKKSDLNEEFRIDSEYYSPDNLSKEDAVLGHNHDYLGNICDLIAGPFGSTVTTERYDKDSGKRYIRAKDIQSFFIDDSDPVFVETNLFTELPQFHLKENDILLTVVGMKFGKAAIICNENIPSIFSCKSTLIRNSKINVWYLLAYLSCNVGYGLVRRGQRGAAQPGINLFDIATMPVPIFSNGFQLEIEYLIKAAKTILENSSASFEKAQDLLLSEIGLSNWKPKHKLSFIKNHSDIQQAGRIDAEYYQPKYKDIVAAIRNYKGGWDTLDNLSKLKDQNFNPVEGKQYKYIELSNITGNGEISNCMIEEGQALPSRARRKVSTGDVIVSSIEGSLSSIALIEKDYNQALCSTGFHVVSSPAFNSETLLVLFKSIVGQLQLKKGCSGTILTAINRDELKKVILPMVAQDKQGEIQQKVVDSFNLRKQSKHLLECAKTAVELAIDQGEQTAISWLKHETKAMQM